jgi:hypothetical protein
MESNTPAVNTTAMPAAASASRPREWGAIAAVIITLVITVLMVVWMRYDLRLINTQLIGDHPDKRLNFYLMEQAYDNLFHRPLDLGYSDQYAGDPVSFGTTIAPYGLVFATLPLYVLTGGNLILTYNLYWFATFALTALFGYALSRETLKASQPAALVAGLMIAFSPLRFWTLSQIELLSTQWYLLGIYCVHRLIREQTVKAALAFALAFWLATISSGYLGYLILFTGGIMIVIFVIGKRDLLQRRFVMLLIGAGATALILLIPFVLFRFQNYWFRTGHNYDVMVYFSARPLDWFVSTTALLGRELKPFGWYNPVYVGLTAAVMTLIAAWIWLTEPDDDTEVLHSPRYSVVTYALIILLGYFLSLGPKLRITDSLTITMPYQLLWNYLPGFKGFRMPAFFMWMAAVGMALLAGYAFSRLSHRLKPAAYRAFFVTALVLIAIDFWPHPGSAVAPVHGRITWPTYRLLVQPIPIDRPAMEWLKAQPPTVIANFPLGPTYSDATFAYLDEQLIHQQPMINGLGSIIPGWLMQLQEQDFPNYQNMPEFQRREVDYIVVHHQYMTEGERILFDLGLEQMLLVPGWTFALVERFNFTDIYRMEVQPLDHLDFDFSQPVAGAGWGEPDTSDAPNGVRDTAELYVVLAEDDQLQISLYYTLLAPRLTCSALKLHVNQIAVPLRVAQLHDDQCVANGTMPARSLGGDTPLDRLRFSISANVGTAGKQTVLFDSITIDPASQR